MSHSSAFNRVLMVVHPRGCSSAYQLLRNGLKGGMTAPKRRCDLSEPSWTLCPPSTTSFRNVTKASKRTAEIQLKKLGVALHFIHFTRGSCSLPYPWSFKLPPASAKRNWFLG